MTRRHPFPIWVFERIAHRDQYRCRICGQGYIRDDPWNIDHDLPLARGGTNHLDNLRLTHQSCNRRKGTA
jgi:5-methylcytosine-specific restriction endonuclease McrA